MAREMKRREERPNPHLEHVGLLEEVGLEGPLLDVDLFTDPPLPRASLGKIDQLGVAGTFAVGRPRRVVVERVGPVLEQRESSPSQKTRNRGAEKHQIASGRVGGWEGG